jgi:isocitrate dehydrogenase
LAERFAVVAKALAASESKIISELEAAQGQPVDIGGYYHPDEELTAKAMRPSDTLNEIIAAI